MTKQSTKERRRLLGLCPLCGSIPEHGKIRCSACISLRREKTILNRESGLCKCGKSPIIDKKYCDQCQFSIDKSNNRAAKENYDRRSLVYLAYGSKCSCCSQDNEMFLTIDHVNNNGNIHRLQNDYHPYKLYQHIIDSGYSSDYQLLCWNCNLGKTRNRGICPHNGNNRCACVGNRICTHGIPYTTRAHWQTFSSAITAYGGKCVCCSEDGLLLLTLDHIDNNGSSHRRITGAATAMWARANGYPNSLTILCANCNCGRQRNGGCCPHTTAV